MVTAPTHSNSAELVATVIDHGPVSAQQLIVIALCLTLNMLDGFDITAMAVTVNSIGKELQLAEDKLGLVFSFALAGMMLGAMFLAAISDVIGRRKTIILSILLVGSTVFLTGYVTSLGELILLRFISGLGAGAMMASQATLASEYSSQKFRALSVAAVTAGYPLGAMLTGLVASHVLPEYGWRGIFFLGGGITLLMSLVALLLIPESLQFLIEKRPVNALARVNRILIKLKRAPLTELPQVVQQSQHDDSRNIFRNMAQLLTPAYRRSTLTLWLTFFLCFNTMYFLMSWIPKLIVNAGLGEQTGHHAFSLFNLGGVIGIFLLGSLATRWRLSNLVASALLISAGGMVLFAMAPTEKNLLLFLIFLIGIALQGGFTGLYAVATYIYPTEIRSTGVGWAIGLARFGAVVGPAMAGVMIASGVGMAGNFYVFAIPMAIAGLIAYRLHVS